MKKNTDYLLLLKELVEQEFDGVCKFRLIPIQYTSTSKASFFRSVSIIDTYGKEVFNYDFTNKKQFGLDDYKCIVSNLIYFGLCSTNSESKKV